MLQPTAARNFFFFLFFPKASAAVDSFSSRRRSCLRPSWPLFPAKSNQRLHQDNNNNNKVIAAPPPTSWLLQQQKNEPEPTTIRVLLGSNTTSPRLLQGPHKLRARRKQQDQLLNPPISFPTSPHSRFQRRRRERERKKKGAGKVWGQVGP